MAARLEQAQSSLELSGRKRGRHRLAAAAIGRDGLHNAPHAYGSGPRFEMSEQRLQECLARGTAKTTSMRDGDLPEECADHRIDRPGVAAMFGDEVEQEPLECRCAAGRDCGPGVDGGERGKQQGAHVAQTLVTARREQPQGCFELRRR